MKHASREDLAERGRKSADLVPPMPPASIIQGFPHGQGRPIGYCEIGARVTNALQSLGVNHTSQIALFTDAELLRVPNFGRKSLKELKDMLRGYGLTLPVSS